MITPTNQRSRSSTPTRQAKSSFWTLGEVRAIVVVGMLMVGGGLVGCDSSGSSSGDMSSRQDAAMKDPFSYGPAEHSGKGVSEPKKIDRSAKGEWDRFWNP